MRTLPVAECTCERDPLGYCRHCAFQVSNLTWDVMLADCLAELEAQEHEQESAGMLDDLPYDWEPDFNAVNPRERQISEYQEKYR